MLQSQLGDLAATVDGGRALGLGADSIPSQRVHVVPPCHLFSDCFNWISKLWLVPGCCEQTMLVRALFLERDKSFCLDTHVHCTVYCMNRYTVYSPLFKCIMHIHVVD